MIKGFGKCFGLRRKKNKTSKKHQVNDDDDDNKLVNEHNNAKVVPSEKNNAKAVNSEQNNANQSNAEQTNGKKEVEEEPIVKEVSNRGASNEWYKIVKNGNEVNVSKEEFEQYMNSDLNINETRKGVSGREVIVQNEWFKIVKDGKEITVTKDEFDNYMKNTGFKPLNKQNGTPTATIDEVDSFEPILRNDYKNEEAELEPLTDSEFVADVLKWHNEYRRKHGVADLVLSPKLSEYASEWANHMAKSGQFTHRPDTPYGENIWYRSFSDSSIRVTGKDPVDDWYGEVSRYKFGVDSNTLTALHFTQVVWKSSKELGVGMARSGNKWYVVCNYDPSGNNMGDFAPNVPAPIN